MGIVLDKPARATARMILTLGTGQIVIDLALAEA
jgi:hypothetical protein